MSTYVVNVNGESFSVTLKERRGTTLTFLVDGREYSVSVAPKQPVAAFVSSDVSPPSSNQAAPTSKKAAVSSTAELLAPIPGIVSDLKAAEGQQVSAGETVVVLEAMKMENPIKAHRSGRITRIHVKRGDEVAHGAPLVSIEE
jgi:biotin carboxyl carrier protein